MITQRLPGLENLRMQGDEFFNQLVEGISWLRTDAKYSTASIKESGVMETIRMQTGLNVDWIIQNSNDLGAYVMLPTVDRNHPFIQDSLYRKYGSNDTGVSALNFKSSKVTGTVNTATCKVSGWFSEIRCSMNISLGLLKTKQFTNEEVAAIVLHELGHLFTYFLLLGNSVISNIIVSSTARSIVTAKDEGERKYILEEAERTLGVELPNKEMLSKMSAERDQDAAQTIMLTSLAEKVRTETGFNIYEVRSCEQLADTFAVKHGAGVHLASGLDRIYNFYGHRAYRNRMIHVVLEIAKLIAFAAGLWLTGVIPLVIYVIFVNPLIKEYDDPQQRLNFIVNKLTDEVKDRKLPDDRRRQLLADIELAKQIADKADDKRTLYQVFWEYCRSEGSKAAKEEQMMKQIEELMSNGLFRAASEFALLK